MFPQRPARPRTNCFAVAALVLGIVGLCGFLGILGLVFGYIAKRRIVERNEAGDGLATAGIVLGRISVVGTVVQWRGW
ncbi:DUF4190 domain-containing protein [Glycomyces paridis]|uniref:DUF4190 domain-containing protein n=1 Tax=Glycomyces paridis TaxID=2126555 RepID=A0A4S8P282_9ACTN|nr:DUF4190 domain-containing protein [Glycomyces paridis]THV21724.1 DUF4190 domain-containing protein [Glycomyces paridis]